MKIDARDYLEFLTENIEHLSSNIQPLWHPLGFSSCVIREDKGELILRLHYWPKKERRTKNPDWPIHTHSYDLSSLVLQGEIEDLQYKISTGNDYDIYKVSYHNGNSEITKTEDRATISETTHTIQRTGDQYEIGRGVFHQSRVKFDSCAVTLVALSKLSSEAPLVLGNSGLSRYPYDRTPFNRQLFWSAVRDSIPN